MSTFPTPRSPECSHLPPFQKHITWACSIHIVALSLFCAAATTTAAGNGNGRVMRNILNYSHIIWLPPMGHLLITKYFRRCYSAATAGVGDKELLWSVSPGWHDGCRRRWGGKCTLRKFIFYGHFKGPGWINNFQEFNPRCSDIFKECRDCSWNFLRLGDFPLPVHGNFHTSERQQTEGELIKLAA